MNEIPFEKSQNSDDELQAEYQKAKPNRFATRSGTRQLTVVVLDEDVAQVFTTPESVNKVIKGVD
ncbi:MAG: hypothetical protein V7K57_05885 [Nostoc sp.]|uniref:hypothetical protein n=1 Tax=Nostoc sp. TaxID=1180 RepID=UPI002FF90806